MKLFVTRLFRYPIKGMGADALDKAVIVPGEGVEEDGLYTLVFERSSASFLTGLRMAEGCFVTLADAPELARLEMLWSNRATVLSVEKSGSRLAWADLSSSVGRARISDFFAAFLRSGPMGQPRLSFVASDRRESRSKVVRVIFEESLRALEKVARCSLDMRRFRPHLVLSGVSPWKEFSCPDRDLIFSSGVRLRPRAPMRPGAIANVDPKTGDTSLNVTRVLIEGLGFDSFGFTAEAVQGGELLAGAQAFISAITPSLTESPV